MCLKSIQKYTNDATEKSGVHVYILQKTATVVSHTAKQDNTFEGNNTRR